jgi:energy-coupling factor transporter ATP-binding protein EcfA2
MDVIKLGDLDGGILYFTGDLALPNSGVVAISGENGVGKSTLLGKISNYLIKNKKSDQFFLSQRELRPMIALTLAKFLEQFYIFHAEEKIFSSYAHLLNFPVEELRDISVHHLSGGQRQLLKLAMAFSLNKKMLLLDEPFTFLDEQRRALLMNLIKEEGKLRTILVVDHHRERIAQYGLKHYELECSEKILVLREKFYE